MKPTLTVPLEIKSLAKREFEGHGSVFRNVDLGGDIVVPGAFARSLAEHRKASSLPQMFWMHDPSRVPGKWIDMREDDEGLAVKGVLAETELGNEIHTLLKMDAVRGLSIGYRTRDYDFDKDGNRLIQDAELWEVSVVSLPMNPLAQVAHVKARLSADGAYVPTPREMEAEFRRMRISKSNARRIVSVIYNGAGEMPEPDEMQDKAGAMLAESGPTGGNRCDADEDQLILKALQELNDSIAAERMQRLARSWRKTA